MPKSSQIYLVTGAAGFIGSNLCRRLLNDTRTATVIGVDNINGYYNRNIKKRRIKELSKNARFICYKTSILEKRNIRNITAKHRPTVLIHTAAEVGIRNGEIHPVEYFSTNVVGTITMLEATAAYIRRAIVFSSSSVYGSTKRLPFRESEPLLPSAPLSTYGASKLAMEIAVQTFHKRTQIPITIVRPFSIYGPDGRPDMLPMKLLLSACNKKPITLFAPAKTLRDWTYIDDCIHCILGLMKISDGFRIVNIGNGHPILLNTIILKAQGVIVRHGYTLRYTTQPARPIEMPKTWADTSLLETLLKRNKGVDFEEGFKKTADFFFSHLALYGL